MHPDHQVLLGKRLDDKVLSAVARSLTSRPSLPLPLTTFMHRRIDMAERAATSGGDGAQAGGGDGETGESGQAGVAR